MAALRCEARALTTDDRLGCRGRCAPAHGVCRSAGPPHADDDRRPSRRSSSARRLAAECGLAALRLTLRRPDAAGRGFRSRLLF